MVFGKKGEAVLQKELQQFHFRRVVEPYKPQDLSYEQQRSSLACLMFIKNKNMRTQSRGESAYIESPAVSFYLRTLSP